MKVLKERKVPKKVDPSTIKHGKCFKCGRGHIWMVSFKAGSDEDNFCAVRLCDGLIEELDRFKDVVPLEQSEYARFIKK